MQAGTKKPRRPRVPYFFSVLVAYLLATPVAFGTQYPLTIVPVSIITAGDMSTASITTDPIPISGVPNFTVQCVWTSTPTGTFKLLLSDDAINYNTPTLPTTPQATGSAGSFMLDVLTTSATSFEIVYTRTAGSGTLNCLAFGKK